MVMGLRAEGQKSGRDAARPISISSSVGYEIHEFLAWEALLLDHQRYGEWSTLLSTDLVYRCPVHLFADFPEQAQQPPNHHLQDKDYDFVLSRVRAMERELPTTEEGPLIRAHRLVTNVMASHADCSKEFAVTSYVLVTCSRENEPENKLLAVERRDCLRRVTDSFHIARREVRIARIPAEMRPSVNFL
jgi:3-phenylpropionate/cinnamic acid dioxygenase small subunit